MATLKAQFKCPVCGHRMNIEIREMVPGRTKNCPACNTLISFQGDDGRKAQKALDDFEKTLKQLNRKFR